MFLIKVKICGDNAKGTGRASIYVSSPSSPPIQRIWYGQKTILYLNQVVAIIIALPRCPDQFWSFYSESLTQYSNRTCKDTGQLPSLFVFWKALIDFFIFLPFGSVIPLSKKEQRPVCWSEHEIRRVKKLSPNSRNWWGHGQSGV